MNNVIFWDFDGVILNSNSVRTEGFRTVLADYPIDEVEALLAYHEANGGLSRYVKFNHFFETIRGEVLTEERLAELVASFSSLMKEKLGDRSYLIQPMVRYIQQHSGNQPMYIVSGSDQTELRYLCQQLGLAEYFQGIYGSPTPKIELVRRIIAENNFPKAKCVLIGDSINDYEAAAENGIDFIGYNNEAVESLSTKTLTEVFV